YGSSPSAVRRRRRWVPFLVSISTGWEGSGRGAEPPCSVSSCISSSREVEVPFVSASSGLGTEGWCSAMYCSSLSTRSSRSAIGIRVLNYRYAMIVLFLTGLAATAYMYVHVPTGFVPQEDQNYFIVVVQAPQGASLAYTTDIARQAEQILRADPDVFGTFAVPGFSLAGGS